MFKKTGLFLLAVLIQVLIVAAVPAKQIYARMTGRLITIKTAPVDPYSIMSGYYVTLGYQISRPPQQNFQADYTPAEPVYVLLKEDPNNVWIIDSVNKQPPATVPADKVLIRGRAAYGRIEYGVESYFIPEDKRRTIENDLSNNRDKTFAQIKVDKFGNAALVRLLIGDTIYEY
jgi:uncharacterized membrane-anchored protein